jgi:hypothetical protein
MLAAIFHDGCEKRDIYAEFSVIASVLRLSRVRYRELLYCLLPLYYEEDMEKRYMSA